MIRAIASRGSISFAVFRSSLIPRVSSLPSRVHADTVRSYTTVVAFPDHRLLRNLSK